MDSNSLSLLKKLKPEFPQINFIEVSVNADLPFDNKEDVVIMDNVDRINDVEYITNINLDQLINTKSNSVHDFDLGFQLKYLKKIGKLGKVSLIAIPINKKIDRGSPNYLRIQSILRKLVAQDMQGS